MRELEVKLAAPSSFVMPPLFNDRVGVAHVDELPRLETTTTYFDTADLRLARSGVTLRYRVGEAEGPRWTLKLPVRGEDMTVRDEQHFAGSPDSIPDEARDLVTAYARSGALESVSSIVTRRYRWLLRSTEGLDLAEVVDDEVSVVDDGRIVGRFRELEVEDRRMGRSGLEHIATVLKDAGATASEPIPKSVRALGVRATGPSDVPAVIEVGPTHPSGRVAQAAFAAGLQRLIANDAGVRLGEDDEAVHQMRVATRRLRADLRTFSPLLQQTWAEPIGAELKWLGKVLGAVRDFDVLIQEFNSRADDLREDLDKLYEYVAARRTQARDALLDALRSERYATLLDHLVEAVAAPAFTSLSQAQSGELLPGLVEKTWQKLARAGRGLNPEDTFTAYHRVRIKAKRARYAAEAVVPALDGSTSNDARSFAKATAKLQDDLGELQDAVVAIDLLKSVALENSENTLLNLSLGRLIEREAQRRDRARSEFPRLWKKIDKKRKTKWLSHD
jgi:CHAD domain-containing protein